MLFCLLLLQGKEVFLMPGEAGGSIQNGGSASLGFAAYVGVG